MSRLKGKRELSARFRALESGTPFMRKIGLAGVAEAKRLVPRRTGNLGRTIRLGDVDKMNVQILAGGSRDVGYAAAVEFGTRPHVIVPRKRKVLAWGGERTLGGRLRKGSKATNFARKVNHPGTRARPYLGPGLKAAAEKATGEAIIETWNEAG